MTRVEKTGSRFSGISQTKLIPKNITAGAAVKPNKLKQKKKRLPLHGPCPSAEDRQTAHCCTLKWPPPTPSPPHCVCHYITKTHRLFTYDLWAESQVLSVGWASPRSEESVFGNERVIDVYSHTVMLKLQCYLDTKLWICWDQKTVPLILLICVQVKK